MAKELQFYGDENYDSGLTVVAEIFDAEGSQIGLDIECSEVGSLAIYIGNMPSASPGVYSVRFKTDTNVLIGQGSIEWDGEQEISGSTLNSLIDEIHQIHGLDQSNPMTVTPTQRSAGSIVQVISGDGATNSTVTRT